LRVVHSWASMYHVAAICYDARPCARCSTPSTPSTRSTAAAGSWRQALSIGKTNGLFHQPCAPTRCRATWPLTRRRLPAPRQRPPRTHRKLPQLATARASSGSLAQPSRRRLALRAGVE
jgi:hypothetical protein